MRNPGIANGRRSTRVPPRQATRSGGSVYISDSSNHRIRKVTPDGIITTVAGNGVEATAGDGGPALLASLQIPRGLTVAADGTLYLADDAAERIRRVTPDGIISTVAGGSAGSFGGYGGDGGPAASGLLNLPQSVAVSAEGRLWIADYLNYRIREVRPRLPGFDLGQTVVASQDGGELYVFSDTGRHLRTVDALTGAARYRFNYTPSGKLTSVEDTEGDRTTIERDGAGAPVAIVGPYGQRTVLGVDGNGHLSSIADPAGETVALTADGGGLLTALRDARGNQHEFHYDALGRLERSADPAGGFQALTRTEDAGGHTVAMASAEGRTRAYPMSRSVGNVLRREVRGSDGLSTVSVRDGNAMTTTSFPDGSGSTLKESADPRYGMQAPVLGRLTVSTPGGLVAELTGSRSFTPDPAQPLGLGSLEDQLTVNGRLYRSTFDRGMLQFTDETPFGRVMTTTVDTAGRPVSVEVAGLSPVAYQYDGRGRLASSQQGGRVWGYGYDSSGRLSSITDPLTRVSRFEYDAGDRLTKQVLPDLREIRYGYDASGNLTSLTPPGRPAHGFDYTAVDLTQDYTPPDVGIGLTATAYSYNRDRQLTRVLRPDGAAIDLGYDPAGRLASVTIPRGSIGFGYSSTSGNLTSLTSPDGITFSYEYDGSLPTRETWTGPVSGSVSMTYDTNLRPASQSVNGGSTVSFGYDDDGLLTSAGALSLERQAANGLLMATTLGSVTTDQGYNASGEVTGFEAKFGATSLFQTSYVRDALGRITRLTETVQGTTTLYDYGYDPAGWLETVRTNGTLSQQYGYDANGNRVTFTGATPADTATGTYDDQDRLLRYGNTVFSYTANGELLSKVEGADTTRYTYDDLGNLITVRLPNGDRIDYLIDGQNRRVGRKLNGRLVKAWLYQNGLNPVAELDSTGTVVSRFVYGSRGHVPDYLIRGGATYRVLTDHLGSVRLVVDAATGAVAERLDYDAFGQLRVDTAPDFQVFGFAGGLYEKATGLARFGARDLETSTGRWTAREPLRFRTGGTNLYTYSMNDPVNYLDPTGLRPLTPREANFLKKYFGNALDTSKIDVFASAWTFFSGGVPISPYGNTIRLPSSFFKNKNPACEIDLANAFIASQFAHEATHVWQRQHHVHVSLPALLQHLGGHPYDYRYSDNPAEMLDVFKTASVEQQGAMVEDMVLRDLTGQDTSPFAEVRGYLGSSRK